MAKIKFMPIQNPIDKLYADVTGMPFPVSAAVTGGDAELKFGTLNMELLEALSCQFSQITMTANQDMTGKEVYLNGGGDDNMYFTVKMIPSDSNSKLLVLDQDYENSFTDGMFCYPNDIATTYIQPDDAAGPSTNYHVDYNWGTGVIEYLENGHDPESPQPEFKITFDADLSDFIMDKIEAAVDQGGVLNLSGATAIVLDNYGTRMDFSSVDPASLVGSHFHSVAYASVSDNLQTLCENWDSMNPTDLYCFYDLVIQEGVSGYPIEQLYISARATSGSYVPECTSPEV